MEIGVIGWVILSIVVGCVASKNGRGFGGYFLLSLFLSPLIGFIVLAIRGKATENEIYERTRHIFYCKKCDCVYSAWSTNTGVDNCPECNSPVIETTIMQEDWRNCSTGRKEQLKKAFASGQYLRYPAKNVNLSTSDQENTDIKAELQKYKSLLDEGIITQADYEAKKKQLLGL